MPTTTHPQAILDLIKALPGTPDTRVEVETFGSESGVTVWRVRGIASFEGIVVVVEGTHVDIQQAANRARKMWEQYEAAATSRGDSQ